MQKRALQGQTELNQNTSDSFRVTAYSWRVSQHANRPVAVKELKGTFVKSESLQWCWSITAYSILLWLLGISDELNMSDGLQTMGCLKKNPNRQKLQKQHVYKIKTSSCSQTLSHCEVAGTHGWLRFRLLSSFFFPFFSSGAQKVEDNWISIDGGNIIRKKIDFFYFLTQPQNQGCSSLPHTTHTTLSEDFMTALPPPLSNTLHQRWHEQETLSSNSLYDLWIHFCPFWMSKQYQLANRHANLNFLPVWECVIVKTRMLRFDKTCSPKIAQR